MWWSLDIVHTPGGPSDSWGGGAAVAWLCDSIGQLHLALIVESPVDNVCFSIGDPLITEAFGNVQMRLRSMNGRYLDRRSTQIEHKTQKTANVYSNCN
jgi:hypothetical protein